MTVEQSVTEFWLIVKACLVELYEMPDKEATTLMQSVWTRKPHGRRVVPSARDMVYHADPIHIASGLAGDETPSDELWEGYRRLLKRREVARGAVRSKLGVRPKLLSGNNHVRAVKSVHRVKQALPKKAYAGR